MTCVSRNFLPLQPSTRLRIHGIRQRHEPCTAQIRLLIFFVNVENPPGSITGAVYTENIPAKQHGLF